MSRQIGSRPLSMADTQRGKEEMKRGGELPRSLPGGRLSAGIAIAHTLPGLIQRYFVN